MNKAQAIEALSNELQALLKEARDTGTVHPFSLYRAGECVKAARAVLEGGTA